ncbi:unnamed protein product, partial [Ectocarpus sp. 8 AP-2014]
RRARYGSANSLSSQPQAAADDRAAAAAAAQSSRPGETTGLLPSRGGPIQEDGGGGGRPVGGLRSVGFSDTVELASFEHLLEEEIDKARRRECVERFYLKVVNDLEGELTDLDPTVPIQAALESHSDRHADPTAAGDKSPWVMKSKPKLDKKREDSLKRALLDLYRDLTLLQNFAIVNYTAVVKITKKYDKQVVGAEEQEYPTRASLDPAVAITGRMLEHLHHQDFYHVNKLRSVTAACETFYAGIFCGGNVAQARGLMLPQKTDERIDLAQFQLGYRMGMAAVLAFWILWDCCLEPEGDDPGWQVSVLLYPAFPVRAAASSL